MLEDRYIEFYDLSLVQLISGGETLEIDTMYKVITENTESYLFEFKGSIFSYPKKSKMYRIKKLPVVQVVDCLYYNDQFICRLPAGTTVFNFKDIYDLGYKYVDPDYIEIKRELI